jgi:hypothetical protein
MQPPGESRATIAGPGYGILLCAPMGRELVRTRTPVFAGGTGSVQGTLLSPTLLLLNVVGTQRLAVRMGEGFRWADEVHRA